MFPIHIRRFSCNIFACFPRLQIRTSCRRLCDLLPFVSGQLDTATTLELTAKYMSYLKETLPPDTLSKVGLLHPFSSRKAKLLL